MHAHTHVYITNMKKQTNTSSSILICTLMYVYEYFFRGKIRSVLMLHYRLLTHMWDFSYVDRAFHR